MDTYLCNDCGSGYLENLHTGNSLSTADHWKSFATHTVSRPTKKTNGKFHDTSTGAYQSGARIIAASGFIEIEAGGCVNAYFRFGGNIGDIEMSGLKTHETSLGKAVLLNFPNNTHWFPGTGCNSPSGSCNLGSQ